MRTASLRRRVAYALATSDELEAAVRRVPPLADAAFCSARRYVAGGQLEDARDLVARGIPVRLYVPYGRNWFRYWTRRMAEAQGA